MTKKPLSAMSSAVKTSSSAVIAARRVSRYFEEDRLARAVVAEATSRLPGAGRTLRVAGARSVPMRIVSLVPHATELLFALGLGDDVVAVTHECDYPLEVLELPHVTRDVLPAGLAAAEIDAAVRERTQQGKAIYELDEGPLARARARPHRHPGAVRRLRGLLRRRRARSPSDRDRPAASSRWTRRPSARRWATSAHRPGDRRPRRRARPRHAPARADRRGAARRQGRRRRSASPRSSGSTRCSSPGTGRRRSSSSRAAPTCSASPASTPSRPRGRSSRPRGPRSSSSCRAATTPSARARRRWPTPTSCAASAPSGSSRSTRRRTSRAPARAWSTASS